MGDEAGKPSVFLLCEIGYPDDMDILGAYTTRDMAEDQRAMLLAKPDGDVIRHVISEVGLDRPIAGADGK